MTLIESLLDPFSYPEHPGAIELRQTHVSYLIFTPEFVYKIKKPVNFGFLDFTTSEKRLFYCNEEVRLNRRLAPSVYLGVVNIIEKDGRFFMGGPGKVVEYAVKMKRLPENTILSHAITHGTVGADIIRRIAASVASFHAMAETSPRISGFGSLEVIRKNTEENFSQTSAYIGTTISLSLYEKIKEYTDRFMASNKGLFEKRVEEGFIRDCHGDIHSEHISVMDGISIIDCIEFNERFRFSDVVADIAFLSMDLDYLNRPDLARVFDSEYFAQTGDKNGTALLDFYKCYRAYVRGKVEGFKSSEKEVSEGERVKSVLCARYHFYLAGLYAAGHAAPMMIIVSGLSGTGKTTIAEAISEAANFTVISSDRVRKSLAGIPEAERRVEEYRRGIYSDEFTDKTYAELIRQGETLLRQGRSVILDATFSKKKFVQMAEAAAKRTVAVLRIIKCTAPDEGVRLNFLKREKEAEVSDADWKIYLEQKKVFDGIEADHVEVDTSLDVNENLKGLFGKIFG